jgi:hypothetical protein
VANAKVNGIALGTIAVGGIFAYSGLFNKKITSTIQKLIQGKNPSTAVTDTANKVGGGTVSTGAVAGGAPASPATLNANEKLAQSMAAALGWTGSQWNCLYSLWTKESGFSNTAENASGAYGIAQALPNTKYPLAGRPPSEGGSAVASVQIAWGLAYIKARYGNPCGAWAHETADDWY